MDRGVTKAITGETLKAEVGERPSEVVRRERRSGQEGRKNWIGGSLDAKA